MSFLKNIQSKSSSAKAGYTFGIAFAVTGVIAIFWVSTFPSKFAQIGSGEGVQKEEEKGFDDLLDEAGSQLGNIIDTTKDTVQSLEAVTQENEGRLGTLGESETQIAVVQNEYAMDTLPKPGENTAQVFQAIPDVALISTGTVPMVSTTPQVTPLPTPSVIQREPRVVLIGTTTSSTTSQ